MKYTAKTETLCKVVDVLREIGAKEIEGLTSNVAQDIGEALLKKARQMKQDKEASSAAKERVREQSKQISQGKAWKNPPWMAARVWQLMPPTPT